MYNLSYVVICCFIRRSTHIPASVFAVYKNTYMLYTPKHSQQTANCGHARALAHLPLIVRTFVYNIGVRGKCEDIFVRKGILHSPCTYVQHTYYTYVYV